MLGVFAALRFVALAFLVAAGIGRAPSADEIWQADCARVKEAALPAADQPDGAAKLALAGCRSEDLFYGIGQSPDPQRARLCAYLERSAGDTPLFGGSAILMTIYATGVGARRNPDLAIRFACTLDGAPAEMQGRIAHLQKLKASARKEIVFDLCDDITSGFMMGACAAHAQRMEEAKRTARYRAKLAGRTASERAAFAKLRQAARAFFQARSSNEVDLSGTARAEFEVEEDERLEGSFAAFLDKLERGTVRPASEAELADADRRLNAVYGQVMNGPQRSDQTTVTTPDIRKTERTWPAYRDAWTEFAAMTFPHSDARGIKTWLTRERTRMLEEFLPGEAQQTAK
jgi:uncharacterized protein YecT (DUF1311 family)